MTKSQIDRWKALVNDLPYRRQHSINVGGKFMRSVIVAVDQVLSERSLCPNDDEQQRRWYRLVGDCAGHCLHSIDVSGEFVAKTILAVNALLEINDLLIPDAEPEVPEQSQLEGLPLFAGMDGNQ